MILYEPTSATAGAGSTASDSTVTTSKTLSPRVSLFTIFHPGSMLTHEKKASSGPPEATSLCPVSSPWGPTLLTSSKRPAMRPLRSSWKENTWGMMSGGGSSRGRRGWSFMSVMEMKIGSWRSLWVQFKIRSRWRSICSGNMKVCCIGKDSRWARRATEDEMGMTGDGNERCCRPCWWSCDWLYQIENT